MLRPAPFRALRTSSLRRQNSAPTPIRAIYTRYNRQTLSWQHRLWAVISPGPTMMRQKTRSTLATQDSVSARYTSLPSFDNLLAPDPKRRKSQRRQPPVSTNPEQNADILDGPEALLASPDADENGQSLNVAKGRKIAKVAKDKFEEVPSLSIGGSGSSLSGLSDVNPPKQLANPEKSGNALNGAVGGTKMNEPQFLDPEADGDEEADEEEIQEALSRPPPVHSDYLPLPWKGRLGYACLCTYLRYSNPPVFSSRTCRIASILENRHPLKDPAQAPHATKNRPDRGQPADIARGRAYVEGLGLANARDVIKMLRWNDRYNIKFHRLSSEMFPFCSHEEYGYRLAPFASQVLETVGKVAAELGHRLTTHPGQFTQLGSPRKSVIENSLRDLQYHAELLSLLKLPPQQDRDAVMILHLGGVFGDKVATLNRFRANYKHLSPDIKYRLVLENDDVSWSVHDLLPLCEELNIPMVLDFHHHNIIFDSDQIREGTKDIVDLFPRILATWRRKKKTPKMHYSEPTPAAISGRQRRKHSPRVATLPPCPPDMDLMIEAKDKEQAVFELMRTFKLPGHNTFNDMLPHIRQDDNKVIKVPKKQKPRKKKGKTDDDIELEEVEEEFVQTMIPEDEVGMGGPNGRVYWPPGMEPWLRPVKKIVTKKDPDKVRRALATKRKVVKEEKEDQRIEAMPIASARSITLIKPNPEKAVGRKQEPAMSSPSASNEQPLQPPLDSPAKDRKTSHEEKAARTRKRARAKKANNTIIDDEE